MSKAAYLTTGSGYGNGISLGRLVQPGIRTRF
ncbi:hypothetical protein M2338_000202 [Sphingobium sp. B2D3B]|nr:hypothetical protein [Sphingobium sp. B2D3B]MCW2399255.1 hypothetical protein [Sphingobium sp. B2D3C]